MKHLKIVLALFAVILLTVVMASLRPPSTKTVAQESHVEPAQSSKKNEPIVIPTEAQALTVAAEIKPPEPVVVPPQPECGPASPKRVYDILISIGVPPLAAVQQVGSWKSESGLDPCQKRGDSGIAWGLNSWHPGRRVDMPEDLTEQIKWAILTEMPRDCRSCYDQYMAAESIWSIRNAIQRSTRWGDEGGRWLYADQFSTQL